MAHLATLGNEGLLRAIGFSVSLMSMAAAGFASATEGNSSASIVQSAPAANTTGNQATPSPVAANKTAPVQQRLSRPLWSELTHAQQQALGPLAKEWDKLDAARKTKWLVIGNKYAAMKPDEQQRVQERMREWVKLTPIQRRTARESYARARKLDSGQKSHHWQQYQQLSDEQKQKLAADVASKKQVAALPSTTPSKSKPVTPIKSTPKPILEQSVTPQAAGLSALQVPPEPAIK
jgi:hypothetical protein